MDNRFKESDYESIIYKELECDEKLKSEFIKAQHEYEQRKKLLLTTKKSN